MEDFGKNYEGEDGEEIGHNYKGIEMFLCFLGVAAGFIGVWGSLGNKVSWVTGTAAWLVLQWLFSLLNHIAFCRGVNEESNQTVDDDPHCSINTLSAISGILVTLLTVGVHLG